MSREMPERDFCPLFRLLSFIDKMGIKMYGREDFSEDNIGKTYFNFHLILKFIFYFDPQEGAPECRRHRAGPCGR